MALSISNFRCRRSSSLTMSALRAASARLRALTSTTRMPPLAGAVEEADDDPPSAGPFLRREVKEWSPPTRLEGAGLLPLPDAGAPGAALICGEAWLLDGGRAFLTTGMVLAAMVSLWC